MLISDEIKEMILSKYKELKSQNKTEGVLDEESLGGLTVFVNNEPKSHLIKLTFGDDSIYLGSNDL